MKLSLSKETLRTLMIKTGVRAGNSIPVVTNPDPDPPGTGGTNSGFMKHCGSQVANGAGGGKQLVQLGINDAQNP